MNKNQYQSSAINTMATIGSKKDDFYHMGRGVFTEVGELIDAFKKHHAYGKKLDVVNVKEEVGDLLWYIANVHNLLGTKMYLPNLTRTYKERDLVNAATRLYNVCNLYHSTSDSEPVVSDFKDIIYELESVVVAFCKHFKFDIYKIMDSNIDKLKVRYPEKFSSERAVNRDLDKEREVLENE